MSNEAYTNKHIPASSCLNKMIYDRIKIRNKTFPPPLLAWLDLALLAAAGIISILGKEESS